MDIGSDTSDEERPSETVQIRDADSNSSRSETKTILKNV